MQRRSISATDSSGSTSSGQNALSCAEHANNIQLIAFLRAHQVGVSLPVEIAPAPHQGDATRAALEAKLQPKHPCVRLDEIRSSPARMELYGAVRDCERIGPPRYFPAYMVSHGIGAIQSALANQAQSAPLEPNFDAAGAWTSLLANYLNCSMRIEDH